MAEQGAMEVRVVFGGQLSVGTDGSKVKKERRRQALQALACR